MYVKVRDSYACTKDWTSADCGANDVEACESVSAMMTAVCNLTADEITTKVAKRKTDGYCKNKADGGKEFSPSAVAVSPTASGCFASPGDTQKIANCNCHSTCKKCGYNTKPTGADDCVTCMHSTHKITAVSRLMGRGLAPPLRCCRLEQSSPRSSRLWSPWPPLEFPLNSSISLVHSNTQAAALPAS